MSYPIYYINFICPILYSTYLIIFILFYPKYPIY